MTKHGSTTTPEAKKQLKQVEADGSASKMAKPISLANKDMANILQDAHGIILIDYLKKKDDNRRILCNITELTEQWIKEKQPHFVNKSALSSR